MVSRGGAVVESSDSSLRWFLGGGAVVESNDSSLR